MFPVQAEELSQDLRRIVRTEFRQNRRSYPRLRFSTGMGTIRQGKSLAVNPAEGGLIVRAVNGTFAGSGA